MSVQSVYRWRSRLRPYLTTDESPFVEMKLPTPKAKRSDSSESLQIFAGDLRVEVPAGFDGELLRRVLTEIRGC
ncbi:MAG: hypothetical protein V3W41_14035 [Planctomycetota bacterium]